MHNKSNLHVFILYINVIISYSFKEFAKNESILCLCGRRNLVATILEITQDTLSIVQTLHFNIFFFIKYTPI